MKTKRDAEALQRECDEFNRANPVGRTVKVWTGVMGKGTPKIGQVREPAFVLSGHTPVVFVTGVRGCVALSHVRSAI